MIEKRVNFPLVSIGIPTYNGAQRIRRALDSLWAQQYPNLEVIISDNCSIDTTQQVCATACLEHGEIRYYRHSKNIGLVPNFEFALSKANGKYFMWLSDDDRLAHGALMRYVDFLEANADYSLVSGQICYWKEDHLDYVEKDFGFSNQSPFIRTMQYYFKAIYGGMFHGLMRVEKCSVVPSRNVVGNDFHFVATLAFLGKIKNLEFAGYHKQLGGSSKDMKKSALALGESRWAASFPRIKIACDAFAEIFFRSQVFSGLGKGKRLLLGISCFLSSYGGYHLRVYPFIVAGKIKRILFKAFNIQSTTSVFKKSSMGSSIIKTITYKY
jgi:glycosyltransferase involved in cell wall biosynthesis